jgi:hypothetical protein
MSVLGNLSRIDAQTLIKACVPAAQHNDPGLLAPRPLGEDRHSELIVGAQLHIFGAQERDRWWWA